MAALWALYPTGLRGDFWKAEVAGDSPMGLSGRAQNGIRPGSVGRSLAPSLSPLSKSMCLAGRGQGASSALSFRMLFL